jgi:WD40 repeat protein
MKRWLEAIIGTLAAGALAGCGGNVPTKYAKLPGHQDPIRALAFSGDNRLLASGDDGGGVRLWDYHAHKQVDAGQLQAAISGLAFSPDSALLAVTVSNDPKVAATSMELWQVAPLKFVRALPAIHACFAPDSKTLLTVDGTGREVQLWETGTGALLRGWHIDDRVLSVAVAPDGGTAVVGTWPDETPIVLGRGVTMAQAMELLRTDPRVAGRGGTQTKQPDGNYTVTVQPNETFLWVIDLTKPGAAIRKVSGPQNGVDALKFSSDGKKLFAAGWDGLIRQYATDTWAEERRIPLEYQWQNVTFAQASEWYLTFRYYMSFGEHAHYVMAMGELRGSRSYRREDGDVTAFSAMGLSADGFTVATARQFYKDRQPAYPIDLWSRP